MPWISGRLLVTDEHLNVSHWVELSPPSEADAAEYRCPPLCSQRTSPASSRLHWLTYQGCKRKAVFLILAVTPGKVLRTKPQNLLIRLPIQNLEAVA